MGFWNFSGGAKVLLALCAVVLLAEGVYINHVMGGNLTSVFSQMTSCERVIEKWKDANPEQAKDRDVYTGPIAAIDFENTNLSRAREFKTDIEEAVAKGVNFGGKYAVAQWSCGTQCQNHALVNVETGKLITLGPRTEAGVGINETSPILITNPAENFPPIAEMQKADLQTLTSLANIPREYYVLVGDNDSNVGIQKICTENPFER